MFYGENAVKIILIKRMRDSATKLGVLYVVAIATVGCVTSSSSNRSTASQPAGLAVPETRAMPVTFNGANLLLHGTVTYPASASRKNFPALLLIPGSGPTDRDGNQPGLTTDLLKQIADKLANQGIASLRFDKRSVKSYAPFWPQDMKTLNEFFSWENFIADAVAAFEFLKGSTDIDPDHCSILGHSEGGLIASQISAKLKPAALILMAAPGRPLGEVLQSQVDELLTKQNATPDQKSYFLKENLRVEHEIEQTGTVPPDVPLGLQILYPRSAAKFLQSVLPLVPETALTAYRGPVIVMNGQFDSQVSPTLDANRIFESLETRVGTKQQIQLVPGVSHNFKPVNGVTDPGFSGSLPAGVIATILDWISAK